MEYNEVYSKVMQELVRAGSSETVSDLGAHRMNIDKLIKPYEALNPEDSRATDLKNLAESSLVGIMATNGIVQQIMENAQKYHTQKNHK